LETWKKSVVVFLLCGIVFGWQCGWAGVLLTGAAALTLFLVASGYALITYGIGVHRWKRDSLREQYRVAIHEAGHVVFAWLSPVYLKVLQASVLPKEGANGRVEMITNMAPGNGGEEGWLRRRITSRIAARFSGLMSESLFIASNDTSYSGSRNDIREACTLALHYAWLEVSDETIEKLVLRIGTHGFDPSGIADENLREVLQMLQEGSVEARGVLEASRDKIEAVAEAPLREKFILTEGLEKILGPKVVSDDLTSKVTIK